MASLSAAQLAYANEKLRPAGASGDEEPPKYELPLYRTDVAPPAATQAGSGPVAAEVKHSVTLITAVIAFYWVVSLSLVFLNKYIFSSSEYKFPYPLFVTWYQLAVALAMLIACGELGKRVPAFAFVAPFQFRSGVAQSVFPLTLCYVGMLVFNNICLQYVEVTFYQVARSLSIIFNIVFTYTILGKATSSHAIFACAVIFAGFIVGSYGEINFSWIGIASGVASSCFVALYGIYVKKSLPLVDNNEWLLLHYNTAMAVILLLPLVWLFGEFEFLSNEDVVYFLSEPNFWVVMTITAVAGFLINIAIFLQIKVTTPLTNTISGTAKACVQTLLGWLIFQNYITSLNGVGILLSLGGTGWYSWIRYKEMVSK